MTGNAKFTKHFYESDLATDSVYLGPYHRLDYTLYPFYNIAEPEVNRCEYYRDNIYEKNGVQYVRDESDYELLNCVVSPCATDSKLVITPKRLAADPGGAIAAYLNGQPKTDSLALVDQNIFRSRNKYRQRYLRRRSYK